MPVMERIQRSKTRQGENESSDRVRTQGRQQPQRPASPGNQATLRMLGVRNRRPEQEPQTPEDRADQVVGQFESDPFDQSGRVGAELNSMEPDQRGEVLGRVERKVSDAQFERMGKVIGDAGPRSPDAPPEKRNEPTPGAEAVPPPVLQQKQNEPKPAEAMLPAIPGQNQNEPKLAQAMPQPVRQEKRNEPKPASIAPLPVAQQKQREPKVPSVAPASAPGRATAGPSRPAVALALGGGGGAAESSGQVPAIDEINEEMSGAEPDVEPAPAQAKAELESLAEDVGGGGAGPSGGGGGGGAGGVVAQQAEPAPPSVESLAPVAAMSAISGLKVGQIANSIAGIQSSVAGKMRGERSDLEANAPSMERPSGSPQTRDSRIQFPESSAAAPTPLAQTLPIEGEGVAVDQPELSPDPGPALADGVGSPAMEGSGEGGTLTEADAQNLAAAVDEVPTTDPALDQNAGSPPTLELTGAADPRQADDQRAALDQAILNQQEQGSADVAQPMGEEQIYQVVPAETLRGGVAQGGGAGAAAAAPAVDDEAAAIVAEEKQGDQVRASAAQASSVMQAGEQDHAGEVEAQRAGHETAVQDEVQQNAAQQSEARTSAAAGVERIRGEWSQGQQAAVDRAHADAAAAQGAMSSEVAAQRQSGNINAAAEIDRGNRDAAHLRARAESDASCEKASAAQESRGGILDWIASRARAFFEGLKRAVHAIFEVARKALRTVIDGAKRLAAAAIDFARNAIISAIRRAGAALIAIGDVAFAAFPRLRARFRGFIQDRVRAAEDMVNRLADNLKANINRLLNLLAARLTLLLNRLERMYMAAIDIVAAAVRMAIQAAQAAIALFGLLASIVKDVAANPRQWIANLRAAIIDGIRNHLWRSIKEAVRTWFQSRIGRVLRIGSSIIRALFRGGIRLVEVARIAFEALKSAISAALIGILAERLAAMIAPVGGAVTAIIAGLQAAWGAVSRLVHSIAAFVAFLKGVLSGGAASTFAALLARTARAVIDFAANWLIGRIRGAASKIAAKIKAIAKKILKNLAAVAKRVSRTSPADPGSHPVVPGRIKPFEVVPQSAGGQPTRIIHINATLGSELSRTHKSDELTRTILAAQKTIARLPNVSPALEIHYVIRAPKSTEAARKTLQDQFTAPEGPTKAKVIVTWVDIQDL